MRTSFLSLFLRLFLLPLLLGLMQLPLSAQTTDGKSIRPVKNIILMISDGTSLPVLSASRWIQRYQDPDFRHLAIDPHLCGTLVTYSSNAPIGDSAPTTSCYVTGVPSITGFVATYPYSQGKDDLVKLDSAWAYRPMATILEIARLGYHRKVGLVFTCEFCHATPADCSAHSYDRNSYETIIPQMVHNSIDVVIGGGSGYLSDEHANYLKSKGYSVYRDDLAGARNDKTPRSWQLYGDQSLPYNLDRDTTLYPSLAEMTRTAIEKLTMGDRSENGFFLMVEGSKVDWAAHGNDPVGLVSEFIAFDEAVAAALDFAQKDGNTVVIITSDHGNSGFSIGREGRPPYYDKASIGELFDDWSKITRSAEGMAKLLNGSHEDKAQELFEKYCGFRLNKEELEALYHSPEYKNSPIPEADRNKNKVTPGLYNSKLTRLIGNFFSSRLPVGFTTLGHTGEEVFLAIYTPEGIARLVGVNENHQLAHYMAKLLGMGKNLDVEGEFQFYSDHYFCPHDRLLEGYNYELIPTEGKNFARLNLFSPKGVRLELEAFSNIVKIYDGEQHLRTEELSLSSVFVDKTAKMYLSSEILRLL